MTKEECLANGGHCWRDSGIYYKNAVAGAASVGMDHCKHCPTSRRKTSREPWEYEEIDA